MSSDHMNAHTCRDGVIRYEDPCPVCHPPMHTLYRCGKCGYDLTTDVNTILTTLEAERDALRDRLRCTGIFDSCDSSFPCWNNPLICIRRPRT